MRKLISAVAALGVMVYTSTAYAEPIKIRMDNQTDVAPIAIFSEVQPEIKNNRTMVPLRVISENLGTTVNWSGSSVVLTKGKVKVILRPNSNTAVKNGKTVHLDVKPYLKNNRTMVPLRFIAETFGCTVSYSDLAVTVETKPLTIDGIIVKTVQQEYRMTMGGVVNHINGNTFNEAIYQVFMEHKGIKVEAPSSYSWSVHNSEPRSYYKIGQYDFLDRQGNSIKRYDIYSSMQSTNGDPQVLLYEANENQWYRFNYSASQAVWRLIHTAAKNGYLTEISNTVP